LEYLSAAAHPYFDGNTRVHGTITIRGNQDDQLQSVVLEVVQNGAVVATANLAPSAQTQLLNKNFGADRQIEISRSQRFFDLPSDQAALVDGSRDGTLLLRVRASSARGQEATRDFGNVRILVRYTNNNRYGPRDDAVGGDDWIRPSVKPVLEHFPDISWGDMSNMNGGNFFPPHHSHRDGVDVDGWFQGYNNRNAATAQRLIGYLNDRTYGSRIQQVGVTYQRVNGNLFWEAIRNVNLNDGRHARDVIRPWDGHDTHFHWRIGPAAN
jgi:hypothetical protein